MATRQILQGVEATVVNLPGTWPVSGSVAITNIPHVIVDSGSVNATIIGTPGVSVVNTPAVTVSSGSVNATVIGTAAVDVSDRSARLCGRVRLTDDTFNATIKAASTPAVATDTALVVAVSPNNAINATVSGAVSVSNFPATQPVSGTFFQATQPVSGSVSVSNFPVTQPVSGTFFQATQPVSIATAVDVSDRAARLVGRARLTDDTNVSTIKAASTAAVATDTALVVAVSPNNVVPVSGTFFQATQPVSGTFFQATQPVSGAFFQATQPVSIAAAVDVSDRAARLVGRVRLTDDTNVSTIKAAATAALAADTALVVAMSPNTIQPAVSEARASTLWVTATAAVNTAVTLTLPAVAGLFHYITSIEVTKLYSVIGVAAGAGVIITSTNLGGPTWTTQQIASAAGTAVVVVGFTPATPHRSAVVNTNSTIVCPAQLQTIWRINVSYFTAV